MSEIKLSQEEIISLKGSFEGLDSIICKIYEIREPRELLGKEGILVRTLGNNYMNHRNYESIYYDSRRNKEVQTEFAEVIEALNIYDMNPNIKNEVELILEIGDILFQRKVVELKHSNNEDCLNVIRKFDDALEYTRQELGERNISFDAVEGLAEIKYGIRTWLASKGYNPKNKDLELQLCLEAYLK